MRLKGGKSSRTTPVSKPKQSKLFSGSTFSELLDRALFGHITLIKVERGPLESSNHPSDFEEPQRILNFPWVQADFTPKTPDFQIPRTSRGVGAGRICLYALKGIDPKAFKHRLFFARGGYFL